MAFAEASNPAPGSDSKQEALENVERRSRGLSAEMAKEDCSDLGRTLAKPSRFIRGYPAGSSVFEPRYDRGNVSGRSVGARQRRDEDPARDGFPRGFSGGSSSRFGSRRMAPGGEDLVRDESSERETMMTPEMKEGGGEEMMTPEMDSSRSLAIYFDSEQMDRSSLIDDSPVYGSVRTELTPELGSFHVAQGAESEDSDVEEARLKGRKEGHRRHLYSRRKKSAAEKVAPVDAQQLPVRSQLHEDFVVGAERSHDSRRDGYITSRLFAKPLSGRVRS